jgi:exosortase
LNTNSHKWQAHAIILIILILFSVVFFPAFKLIIEKWLASEDYSHAFFIVPIIFYLFWKDRQILLERTSCSPVGLFFLIVSLSSYVLSLQLQVPTIIFLATIATIISGILYIGGLQALKVYYIAIILLFLIIPIPNQVLSMLTGSLQLKISELSEIIIRLIDIPMLREGNVLHIQNISFQVVEACSGVRSLISLTTLSILIGYFTLTKFWSRSLLFIFSIPVALVINLARVVFLVLAYHYFRIDLSAGILHTITGLVLFIIGFILLFTFQKILESWQLEKKKV